MKKLIIFSVFLSFLAMSFVSPVFAGEKWEHKVVHYTEVIKWNLEMNLIKEGFSIKEAKKRVFSPERLELENYSKEEMTGFYKKRFDVEEDKGWRFAGTLPSGFLVFVRGKYNPWIKFVPPK